MSTVPLVQLKHTVSISKDFLLFKSTCCIHLTTTDACSSSKYKSKQSLACNFSATLFVYKDSLEARTENRCSSKSPHLKLNMQHPTWNNMGSHLDEIMGVENLHITLDATFLYLHNVSTV